MPFGFNHSSRRRRSSTSYVAPPVQSSSQSQIYAQSAANHATGTGVSRSSSMTSLSGQAAAAALKKHYVTPQSNQASPQARSNSLSSRSFRPQKPTNQSQRSNSLSRLNNNPYNLQQPQLSRTNSITSQTGRKQQYTNHDDSDIASTTVTTRRGKDPNTLIRTTRELGYDGRTKSLTKETITKMGSFEVVKTTTIKPPVNHNSHADFIKPPSAPSAFYAGSLLSAGDSELENIAEEFDVDYYINEDRFDVVKEEEEEDFSKRPISPPLAQDRSPRSHAYRQLTQSNVNRLNNGASPVRSILKSSQLSNTGSPEKFTIPQGTRSKHTDVDDNDSNSGDSLYSDAYDLLPSASNNKHSKKSIIKKNVADVDSARTLSLNSAQRRPRRDSNTSSTRKSVRIDAPQTSGGSKPVSPSLSQDGFARPIQRQQPELTQEQLYLRALEVAKQKVYGDRDVYQEDEGYNSDSSFKREYPRDSREEPRISLRDNGDRRSSLTNGRRTMSLTSASINNGRTMSMTSGHSYQPQQQQQWQSGFRNHSLRLQHNPMAQEEVKKNNRFSTFIKRTPSMSNMTEGKVDKKLDKKQRKENIKLLEQERKEAIALAEQKVGIANNVQQEPHSAPNSPQKSTVSNRSSSKRFTIFNKKSKKKEKSLDNFAKEEVIDQDASPAEITNTVKETIRKDIMQNDKPEDQQMILEPEPQPEVNNNRPLRDIEYTSDVVAHTNNNNVHTFIDSAVSPELSSQNTPNLSLSNQHNDENSSEPKTLEQEEVSARGLQYEDYETINDQVTQSKQSPVLPVEDDHHQENSPVVTKTEKPGKKNKKNKTNKKSFGKKVLGWFDLDD